MCGGYGNWYVLKDLDPVAWGKTLTILTITDDECDENGCDKEMKAMMMI